MNSHIDFYTGADIYYLADFLANEQQIFFEHISEITKNNESFSIYKYIEWR